MVILGTPYISLFQDRETTLFLLCIVFVYTTLYFYYQVKQLKKKIKAYETEIDNLKPDDLTTSGSEKMLEET
jgi:preprotein translocase subunit YajC